MNAVTIFWKLKGYSRNQQYAQAELFPLWSILKQQFGVWCSCYLILLLSLNTNKLASVLMKSWVSIKEHLHSFCSDNVQSPFTASTKLCIIPLIFYSYKKIQHCRSVQFFWILRALVLGQSLRDWTICFHLMHQVTF